MKVIKYDVVIIGGGAAGIMCAISAKKHHPEYSVAIIDRTFALGRKILVCGAGRCNITNIHLNESVSDRYYGAKPEFTQSVFSQFGYKDIFNFFNDLGIELYTERKTNIGKLFPVTDQAKTVNILLEDELQRLGVDIYLNTECTRIQDNSSETLSGPRWFLETQVLDQGRPTNVAKVFGSNFLVISAGGKTYPALGSDGSGYSLAESLGHRIVKPVPSALPLVGKNPLSQEVNGLKMEAEVSSFIEGKKVKTTTNDVMFTQYGLSGPAILNISREISIYFHRENGKYADVVLNFFPGKSRSEVQGLLNLRWSRRPEQSIEMSLNGIFPPKFPPVLLKIIGIGKEKKVSDLSQKETEILINSLFSWKVQITDTRGWNEAEFTAGGIDTEEVEAGTLESKKIPGLYFCGEILDVDGDVGGFNLSWAWSSGYVVGKQITESKEKMR